MTSAWDEFGLITNQFRPLSMAEVGAFQLTDDAAVLKPTPDHDWVVSADALVAGVHFFADDSPAVVAKKALRTNLSDLAAMGVCPRCVFMTCALPEILGTSWLESFAESLGEDLKAYDMSLAGGDVVATPGPLTLSLTVMGEAANGQVLRRNGVRPGDIIAVTGSIGDSALGLDVQRGDAPANLTDDDRTYLVHRYRLPIPRIVAGQILNGTAHAALDISDGLLADVRHLAKASVCDITIDPSRVPLSKAAQAWIADRPEAIDRIITGGDDYELVFACAPEDFMSLAESLNVQGIQMTAIGRAEVGQGDVYRIQGAQRERVGQNAGHQHGLK